MDMSMLVFSRYLEDLDDQDLLRRPATGCNHIAWQVGHLITSESRLVDALAPGRGGELPVGFAEAHSKEATGVDDPSKFLTKQAYLDLFQKVRGKTIEVLEGLDAADFDLPSPEGMRKMFPTVGQYFTLIATHPMMHAGQFAVVRRQLGKPIVI